MSKRDEENRKAVEKSFNEAKDKASWDSKQAEKDARELEEKNQRGEK